MSESVDVRITTFGGPSLHAPFAAVAADFENPFPSALPAEQLAAVYAELLPAELRQRIAPTRGASAFDMVAAVLANAFQDLGGPNGLPVAVQRSGNGTSRIFLGYEDATAAAQALRAGLEVAAALFIHAEGHSVEGKAIAARVRQMRVQMQSRQPDFIARALIRAARKRGMPVYSVSPGSRVWQYGQGRAGFHFFEAANERDSLTGRRLSHDKFLSNQLVMRLGFPGVVHGLAGSERAATELARKIGYPVVLKPIDGGKGTGVTANIRAEVELQRAFAKANAVSRGKAVIVEKHLAGDDHRLAVFSGKFAWAARRTPTSVTGDGTHTIAQLIDIENRSRSAAAIAAGFDALIHIDADVVDTLRVQGTTLDDRPDAGVRVLLRSANTGMEGSVTDCTAAVHPDNREMAEAIARAFRLDAVGVDFMTEDVGKSWREGDCAITEVNTTPGIASEGRAEIIMRAKFADGDDGRIPCVVLVGGGGAIRKRVADALSAAGRRVGQTDRDVTLMTGQPRRLEGATLASRVTALLLDPACEALVVSTTSEEIERQGFPLDRCDLVLVVGGQVTPPLRRLLEQCAPAVLDVALDTFDRTLKLLLDALLSRRPPLGGKL